VMILGSTIVFASAPAADSSDTSAGQSSVSTELRSDPVRHSSGTGRSLKR